MYNNPYFNPQISVDRINNQIAELEKMKTQLQQPIQPPTSLTQNFQLAPTNRDVIKYAGSIEEVQRDMVTGDTPYFSKEMSVVWIKNTKGEIKTYELTEIIEKDEKDLQIEYLQEQIKELKGMFENEQSIRNVDADETETDATGNDDTIRTTIEKSKPTSIQKLSTGKKRK